jgi:predicted TIM-barrel fold metal-dependent hydrolase
MPDPTREPYIIDTDTHFTEPADLWTERLPKAWGDDVMHVRFIEEKQADMWCVGDNLIQYAWGFQCFGYDGPHPPGPLTYGQCHPATVGQAERVQVMDEMGIRTAVLYPNVAGLSGRQFVAMADKKIAAAHASVYNDFQVEWSARFPGRFIPMLVVPFWDVQACVVEIERLADAGFGGIVMTGAPQNHGEPYIHDPHWDPLWRACVDADLSVSFHVGNGLSGAKAKRGDATDPERTALDPPGATTSRAATFAFLDNGKQVSDLLLSGLLVRYPTLKFVSVESGLGWIPFVLESLDYHFKKTSHGRHPWGDLLPSDLFRRQVYVNYWFEELQPWHLETIGVDNILFETDFPHPTCLDHGDVHRALTERLAVFPEDVREKILFRNAERLYGRALRLAAAPV